MKTRRSVIATTASVIGAAALGGCGVLDDSEGSNGRAYTDWCYGRGETSTFQFQDVDALESVHEALSSDEVPPGIEVADLEYRINTEDATVIAGSFDVDTITDGIVSRLEARFGDHDAEITTAESDQYNGFDRVDVVVNDQTRVWSVGTDGTHAVIAQTERFEAPIDAYANGSALLVDQNDDAARLVEELGQMHRVQGSVALTEAGLGFYAGDPNAHGRADTAEGYGDDWTEWSARDVHVYESPSEIDEALIRAEIEDLDNVEDVTIDTDGRVGVASYTYRRYHGNTQSGDP